jgi:hypothetical protein
MWVVWGCRVCLVVCRSCIAIQRLNQVTNLYSASCAVYEHSLSLLVSRVQGRVHMSLFAT